MQPPINLVPTILKRLQPGIQALTFADKFLQWEQYYCPANCTINPLETLSISSFLKLSFMKYAFGMTVGEVLENALDRRSFKIYAGIDLSLRNFSTLDKQCFEHFVSPFGKLGELIELIDWDLAQHDIYLERKIGSAGFKLLPYLVHQSGLPINNFIDQKIAIWL